MAFLGKILIWALIVVMGVFAVKFVFAALGVALGIAMKLVGFAFLLAIAGGLVYGISRLYQRVKSTA